MTVSTGPLISIIPIYAALLGLLFLPATMRVGFYRINSKILIGDGEDPELLRRIRGQGNFIETVPLALALLICMELMGATPIWLHALGALLLFGRTSHYLGMTELGPFQLRPIGMFSTLSVYLLACGWLLYSAI